MYTDWFPGIFTNFIQKRAKNEEEKNEWRKMQVPLTLNIMKYIT